MARGQRKSIEEKIQQKQEVIDALEVRLEVRIEHEKEELEALLNEQRQKEVGTLYDFIKTTNLDVYEATEVLQQYVEEHLFKDESVSA